MNSTMTKDTLKYAAIVAGAACVVNTAKNIIDDATIITYDTVLAPQADLSVFQFNGDYNKTKERKVRSFAAGLREGLKLSAELVAIDVAYHVAGKVLGFEDSPVTTTTIGSEKKSQTKKIAEKLTEAAHGKAVVVKSTAKASPKTTVVAKK